MPSVTTTTNAQPTTPKKVLSAIHNIPKRMRSGTLRNQPPRPRAPGKENIPPGEEPTQTARPSRHRRRPAPLLPRSPPRVLGLSLGSHASPDPDVFVTPAGPAPSRGGGGGGGAEEKWEAKDGKIVIKVWVPSTDDVWKLRVREDVGIEVFRARVAAKVGFEVSFSAVVCGRLTTIADEEAFKEWVAGRVQNGRNSLLTAHRLALQ